MPLHRYHCPTCKHTDEELYSIHEEPAAAIPCPCGDGARRCMPLIAVTPGYWGDQTGKYGVNGHYDAGLGVTYYNSKQRDAAIKAAGVAPLSDYPAHFWEDQSAKQQAAKDKRDKFAADYAAAVKRNNGDQIRASTEVMPAGECLAGSYDDIY